MKSVCVIGLIFVICGTAAADVDFGAGMSSVTSGRYVPGVSAAYDGPTWMFAGTATGVQTAVYYQSTYSLAAMKSFEVGRFWWGNVKAGIGAGAGYSQRGFRATSSSSLETVSDVLFGPAFRLTWDFVSPVYFSFDDVYGLGLASISLAGQDVVMFSLGCHL